MASPKIQNNHGWQDRGNQPRLMDQHAREQHQVRQREELKLDGIKAHRHDMVESISVCFHCVLGPLHSCQQSALLALCAPREEGVNPQATHRLVREEAVRAVARVFHHRAVRCSM